MQIIEQETDRFMEQLHFREVGPVIQRLKRCWQDPKDQELRRLFNKVPDLDERARRDVRQAFDRLTNKLLHPPLESLRCESRKGSPAQLVDALNRLFPLSEP